MNTDDCFCAVFLSTATQPVVAGPVWVVDARSGFVEAHSILRYRFLAPFIAPPDNGPLGPVYFR